MTHFPDMKNEGTSLLATGHVKNDLLEFFKNEVRDIYWAENHLVKAFPDLIEATNTSKLKEAFTSHLEQTKNHVVRLEKVFDLLEEQVKAKKCDAMEGIIQEGEEIIEETENGSAVRDIGLIVAAQKAEHYEIATYGALVQIAHLLAREDIAEILEETLLEEKRADVTLAEIAVCNINYQEFKQRA